MYSVRPALQPYAWGTTDDIAELLGVAPTGGPVAEAWWGDNPLAPARAVVDGVEVRLDSLIAADPEAALGSALADTYDGRLSFLLKVLAIRSPLSIQVHPSPGAAHAGFDRDDAAAIPLDSPVRTYRDRSHKPEMLVALTPMVVLAGFREPKEIRRDLESLGHPEAAELVAILAGGESDEAAIARYVGRCLGDVDAEGLAESVVRAAREPGSGGSLRAAAAAAVHYPTDGGVLVALAMNRLDLEPGDASFTPDGCVHSYQSGVGIEIMANSDNVVRGGLSPKHIDVDEFLAVASTFPGVPATPRAERVDGAATLSPATEFSLGLVRDAAARFRPGPRIVLSIDGDATVATRGGGERILTRGEAVFVPFADGALSVATSGFAIVAGSPDAMPGR
jgi:mannose-6-phosphate isomerase